MDEDVDAMTRDAIVAEVKKLRAGIRKHLREMAAESAVGAGDECVTACKRQFHDDRP